MKAVIFDYDNTLEEFLPAEAMAETYLAEQVNKKYGVVPREFLKLLNQIKKARVHKHNRSEEYSRILWLTETIARLGITPDYDFIDKLVMNYWKLIEKESRLFPGVIDMLKHLKRKYILGMISDGDGEKTIKLQRINKIGLGKLFDAIVTSDDTGYDKPDKRNFRKACELLNVTPKECYMIGDNPELDLKPAKQLGMKTILTVQAVKRQANKRYVDHIIDDIREIITIIEKH